MLGDRQMSEINGLCNQMGDREEIKTLDNENSEFKNKFISVKPVQLRHSKEPSELQQVYVRKLMITIQMLLVL